MSYIKRMLNRNLKVIGWGGGKYGFNSNRHKKTGTENPK
jgi:hypothetical protein